KFFAFRWFDNVFNAITHAYSATVKLSIKLAIVTILLFGGLLFITVRLFEKVPGGFVPDEDQGYIIVASILPDGASVERTDKLVADIEKFLLDQPEIQHTVTLGGFDFLAGGINSTNTALTFARMKPWDQRKEASQSAQSLVGRTWGRFARDGRGLVLPFNPPAIQGLGQRAGFEFQLQARGGGDIRSLAEVNQKFLAAASKRPELAGLNATLRVNTPQM
ncbi:MAG: efflux RND transporter permease subunit, partial [Phycisphaerae bacterium]